MHTTTASADTLSYLLKSGYLEPSDIHRAQDGFLMLTRSVAQILHSAGVDTLTDKAGECLPCRYFYDDWYLFALPGEALWGLLKMREQENDAALQIKADGDTPGVTIPFLAFDVHTLIRCLSDSAEIQQSILRKELFRVTAQKGQTHHEAFKAYFIDPKSKAPYLIAKLFCRKIAGAAQNGKLPVPPLFVKRSRSFGAGRLTRFLRKNNAAAGYTVCDGQFLYIQDPNALSRREELAILATHTGNVSFHSFAAEVVYHARFLVGIAKIPVPLIGWSVYSSAIRADMSIAASSLETFAPFYFSTSPLIQQQIRCHPNE